MNKENVQATPNASRKRAKSFSTPPSARPAPAIRQARGILKGNGDDAHTIAFIPIHSANKKTSGSAEKRRKSFNRRVSFASHASVRLFEKGGDSPEAISKQPQLLGSAPSASPRRSPRRASPAKSPIGRGMDDSNDDLTMDLTAIMPPTSLRYGPAGSKQQQQRQDDSSSDSEDELAGEDDTAAMDLTDIVPTLTRQHTPKGRSVASPVKQILKSTPLLQPKQRQPVFQAAREDADADASMDMTRAIGHIKPALPSADSPRKQPAAASILEDAEADEESESEVSMEETRIFQAQLLGARSPNKSDGDHTGRSTVATQEDTTQRAFVGEGTATQMDVPQVMARPVTPGKITTAAAAAAPARSTPKSRSPLKMFQNALGFNWGAQQAPASPMDVSMADASGCQDAEEDDLTMDMTTVLGTLNTDGPDSPEDFSIMDETIMLPASIQQRDAGDDSVAGETTEMDMSFTRVIVQPVPVASAASARQTPVKAKSPVKPASPVKTATPVKVASSVKPASPVKQKSPVKVLSPRKRYSLGTGAVRSPVVHISPVVAATPPKAAESAAAPVTPVQQQADPATPIQRTPSRRTSLADAPVPFFNSPGKVLLRSIDRPEFGKDLIKTTDLRVSVLREKLALLTPRKQEVPASSRGPTPKTGPWSPARQVVAPVLSPLEVRSVSVRPETPHKTPSKRSLSRMVTPARSVAPPLEPITLDAFLDMTGVTFLTGLTTTRRRETIQPKLAELPSSPEDADAAKIEADKGILPVFEMYQHSCRELTNYIKEGRAVCTEIEADMNKTNPKLFSAYRLADAAGKRALEAGFREMKGSCRLIVKGMWYAWRSNLMVGVLQPLGENLAALQQQAARLAVEESAVMARKQVLEAAHAESTVRAQALFKDLEEYDALDVDRAQALAAQNEETQQQLALATDEAAVLAREEAALVAETTEMAASLADAVKEAALLERDAQQQRGFSLSELADLKHALVARGRESGWEVVQVAGKMLKLVLRESLAVSLPLSQQRVSPEVSLVAASADAHEATLQGYYLAQLQDALAEQALPAKEALALIKEQWTAVLLLGSQVKMLAGVHPTKLFINADDNLCITTAILLCASRTKFKVSFTAPPVLQDPVGLTVDVAIVYGRLDGKAVERTIAGRVTGTAAVAGKPGWLLESLKMPEGL